MTLAEDAGRPSAPCTANVGSRMRTERKRLGLSVRELARRVGVSASLVSQVENGKARPSVATLYAIANQLGTSIDELLDVPEAARPAVAAGTRSVGAPEHGQDTGRSGVVQRAESRKTLELEGGVRWEQLTPHSMTNTDFLLVEYAVGGSSSPGGHHQRHNGQEWGLILSGHLNVSVGFDEYELGPGDSLTFVSNVPHRLFNVGAEPVRAVWFVLNDATG